MQLGTLLVTMLATVQYKKVSEFRLLSQESKKQAAGWEEMSLIPPRYRSPVAMSWGEIFCGLKISFAIHVELNISK